MKPLKLSGFFILVSLFILSGLWAGKAHSGFLEGGDGGFLSDTEGESKPKPKPRSKSKSKTKSKPRKNKSRTHSKTPSGDIGPIVDNGKVKPMTALRFLDSFNEAIDLTDDQVYMAMGIIKQESWFKVGAKNKATTELMNHNGLYDSDACVGLGQLMAVAIQDLINNDLVPMGIVNRDPDMRDDFVILKDNIIPGTFGGRKVYRYAKKAVVILTTNPKLSLLLSATFIKRTDKLLGRPKLTGKWYNGLIESQQLKAVPMTYNAGIGRAKNALKATYGSRTVENVAPNLYGGADKMYYAKVTRFAKKFKDMGAYDVAVSVNNAIGMRPITPRDRERFKVRKKKGVSPKGVSKGMDMESAMSAFMEMEDGMEDFLTFDEGVTEDDSDFLGVRPMTNAQMAEFRKELNR